MVQRGREGQKPRHYVTPLASLNIKHIKKGALVFENVFSLRRQKNMYKFLWGVVSYLYERNIVLVISTWLT